jgi:hypothetical protein
MTGSSTGPASPVPPEAQRQQLARGNDVELRQWALDLVLRQRLSTDLGKAIDHAEAMVAYVKTGRRIGRATAETGYHDGGGRASVAVPVAGSTAKAVASGPSSPAPSPVNGMGLVPPSTRTGDTLQGAAPEVRFLHQAAADFVSVSGAAGPSPPPTISGAMAASPDITLVNVDGRNA